MSQSVDPRAIQQAEQCLARGFALKDSGQLSGAAEAFAEAVRLVPNVPELHVNFGNILKEAGRPDESVRAYEKAITLRAELPEAHMGLGNALSDLGKFDGAIASYQKAVKLRANYPQAWHNLGGALRSAGRSDEAIEALRRAASQGLLDSFEPLGSVLQSRGRFEEAIQAFQQAIRHHPQSAIAHNNLGIALKDCGRVEEAIASFRRAIQLQSDLVAAHSNLLFTLHYQPGIGAAEILAEHRRFNDVHTTSIKPFADHRNERSPQRRLRIGYVAPDFRDHCQSLFTIPLLSHHDHAAFEIFCYADVPKPDSITERIKPYTDTWRSSVGLSDEQLAEMIRADQIDILVDLTMHMHRGRPLAFARKPAPIQIAWLAYPGTSGLSAMDYRLTDPQLDPPGEHDEFYAEESVRLPHTFWCYDPLTSEPAVNDLPAERNGYVTFGCLSNFCKVNDTVLAMWSRVLRQLPDARLVLLSPAGAHRRHVIERLGVEAARIEFVEHRSRAKYLELYHPIDIQLDTFPYNAHTTGLDSWWMGVPVVSLCGQTAVSRAGLSQATNLGLPELVASDPEGFVRIAVELARDRQRLSELRSTLRARVQKSPLMDGAKFARDVEAVYRSVWRRWCAAAPSDSPGRGEGQG
ncbi:MAG TPA: tetratricopeptide repeat protein [Tepidisphaeraceae bacterium]|jgi:predicted O-linked N-acetylglucosamine transferase (SPINDLY family)